jgi:hypothetical protein
MEIEDAVCCLCQGQPFDGTMQRLGRSLGDNFHKWVAFLRCMNDENILVLVYGALKGESYEQVINEIRKVKSRLRPRGF